MHWFVTLLIALAIVVLAALGAMMLHHGIVQPSGDTLHPSSVAVGMGVFGLASAFMLYRVFFWREAPRRRSRPDPS